MFPSFLFPSNLKKSCSIDHSKEKTKVSYISLVWNIVKVRQTIISCLMFDQLAIVHELQSVEYCRSYETLRIDRFI
jgi:hypothetical protein